MKSRRQRQLTAQATHDFDAFQEELLPVKAECREVRKLCNCNLNSTPARLGGLGTHLETSTCKNATPADRFTIPGGEPEPWRATSPIIST